jgi:Tc toxin complex TcA C-terminal TcB-binding domain
LAALQYIFDPLAPGHDPARFWKFKPFQDVAAKDYMEKFFESLRPGVENASITEWRDNPFPPFVVARSRPVAYMKWVDMIYIQILMEYGDYNFRQNTLESVPRAIQLYVMAGHLFGPKPQQIPKRGKIQPQTYKTLVNNWDTFENAVVGLELVFPFSNQITTESPNTGSPADTPNIFGFATTRHFCIPDNPTIRTLRDQIDDRLFKIRYCEDIIGIVRTLALWDPPLDIAALVAASAGGLSIANVLNDLNTPLPNYRFLPLLDKALEIIQELKSRGESFLSVKEKKDSEALSNLRAQDDSNLQGLFKVIKTSEIDAATKAIDSLQQSRTAQVARMTYFLQLTGDDIASIPAADADFNPIDESIDPPVTDGKLRLIAGEKEDLDKQVLDAKLRLGAVIVETLVAILAALPSESIFAALLGIGGSGEWGPLFLAKASEAVVQGISVAADQIQTQASMAGSTLALLRQLQDRRRAANDAGYEIKNLDKQILVQQVRMTIANQQWNMQQVELSNAQEVESFLRSKYTNQDLFTWMEGQLRTLYDNTYTLAYDLAKGAETEYHFERPLESDKQFIEYRYWDPSHDGLLCGDRLFYGLKRLGAEYRAQRGYDYEITKHVSLKRIDPLSLLQFRETAIC